MLDFLRWRLIKKDTAPGTLIYAGQKQDFPPKTLAWTYDAENFEELDEEGIHEMPEGNRCALILQLGVHDAGKVARLGERTGLQPLTMEDILNTSSRPKMEWVGDQLFLVLKDFDFHQDTRTVRVNQVSIVLEGNRIMAFEEKPDGRFDNVMERLRRGKGRRIRTAGSAYLLAALMDALLDSALDTLARMAACAEELEASLDEDPSEASLRELYRLRRELIPVRAAIQPMRDIVDTLLRSDDLELNADTRPYMLDVRDHAHLAGDTVNSMRDMLAEIMDLQISLAGLRMNRIMQFLTLIATIFIPLTFVAGIYGMNFENMPELKWEYGYFLALGFMIALAGGLLAYFLRRRWL